VRVAADVRRVALLGATGSIGRQALEVISARPELSLCALASGSQPIDDLAAALGVEHVQVGGDLTELLEAAEPDLVLNAVVGFAGVGATLWALEHGVTLALANKESLVAAGDLAVAAWKRGGGLLLPVDSEHSALFQCLEGRAPETVESVVLTASGGPFRNRSSEELESVTVEEALAHPTWSMGPKITIDSATLMNKGLELIEAHHLFEQPGERLGVLIHPQSIVHGLVSFANGYVLAAMGATDMRTPIAHCLAWPEPGPGAGRQLDLATIGDLEFAVPDEERFPALRLARAALDAGGWATNILSAANEIAVSAFLAGQIGFLEIAGIVEDTLARAPVGDRRAPTTIEEAIALDAEGRRIAGGLIEATVARRRDSKR
jgi:1-deoxy-D-xylulose-5-phosphate reductoisomerase